MSVREHIGTGLLLESLDVRTIGNDRHKLVIKSDRLISVKLFFSMLKKHSFPNNPKILKAWSLTTGRLVGVSIHFIVLKSTQ